MQLTRSLARWRRRPHLALLPLLAIALVVVAVAYFERELPEEFGELAGLAGVLMHRFGAPASLALLYLEETGIPSPVPGDVYVAYLGSLASGSLLRWIAAWLALIAIVVGGSSNLYLVSRRWGHRLVDHRLAAALHIDRRRLEVAERWMGRWGPIAIIFGRHLPGLRIPITVMAGVLEVRYSVFALSVAVSTAVWAGIWLFLGARFGARVAHVFGPRPWLYLLLAAIVGLLFAYAVLRIWRATDDRRVDP